MTNKREEAGQSVTARLPAEARERFAKLAQKTGLSVSRLLEILSYSAVDTMIQNARAEGRAESAANASEEEAGQSVTARLPAEARDRLAKLAQKLGLSVSRLLKILSYSAVDTVIQNAGAEGRAEAAKRGSAL